jgi:hypothetical protein
MKNFLKLLVDVLEMIKTVFELFFSHWLILVPRRKYFPVEDAMPSQDKKDMPVCTCMASRPSKFPLQLHMH